MGIQVGQTRLLLASASPRRRQLLQELGLRFEVQAADIDESVGPGEAPHDYVARVAHEKAAVIARREPGAVVLAADTSVVLGDVILGKPNSAEHAAQLLASLSGRTHVVLTAVALEGEARGATVVETRVVFRPLTGKEIHWYVQTGEPLDKAGAYALQGAGGAFVTRIEGSVSNVVGLPLVETLALLQRAGIAMPWAPVATP